MIMEYIDKNYQEGEPIFLDEMPSTSPSALRQQMKKLTDEGILVRLYNGVYYKSYKDIFGKDGRMSITKFIEKKYLLDEEKRIGFLSGLSLYNKYGFTSQLPSIFEVISNEASTKQRKTNVDGYTVIVYKPVVEIDEDNIDEVEFLTLMSDIDTYSELTGDELIEKIKEFLKEKTLDFNKVKTLLPLFPIRIYKNLYEGGLMNELV